VPSPDDERLDALTEAIVRLLRRVGELERRLDRLEHPGQGTTAASPAADPRPSGPASPPEVAPEPVAAPVLGPLETRFGLTLINRIGVLTLVIGFGFFFRYAVESRWIGETGRVLTGVAFAALAFAAGERAWRSGQRVFAQGLTGAGAAILYLSLYAAFALYGLIPLSAAFGAMSLAVAAAAGLAIRYRSAAIAALALAGGYITPPLLGAGEDSPWFVLGFVLLLSAAAVWLPRWLPWRGFHLLALAASFASYSLSVRFQPENRLPGTIFALATFALFAPLGRVASAGAHLLAFWVIAGIWQPEPRPRIVLTLILLAASLALAGWRRSPAAALAALAAFYIGWWTWPGSSFFFLSSGFLMLCLSGAGIRMVERPGAETAGFWTLLSFAFNAPLYFTASYPLLEAGSRAWLAVGIAVLHLGLAAWLRNRDSRLASLCAGLAWAFLTLAVPSLLDGYRATMVWALEGAALAWIAHRTSRRLAGWAGIGCLALAVIRLSVIEAGVYPQPWLYAAVLNARFLVFATVAVSFWAAAYWLPKEPRALLVYLAGHLVMLWNLGLEVAGWAARNVAPEDFRSVNNAALSTLMAAYAVLLVAAGRWPAGAAASRANRVLGLSLIGLVVLKLYLYDVWLLGRLYRIAAFSALGALLLLMSYLYSRRQAAGPR